jgi:hypothetical protein
MKSLLVGLFLTSSLFCFSQRLHLNLAAGMANYYGDMNEHRYTLNQARGAFSIGAGYELSDKFILRAGLTLASIGADDKKGKHTARNLNFESSITEGQLALEYFLRDPYQHRFIPYIFAGVAVFQFNPYTHDSTKKKVYLQPLSTEGQGFVAGRNVYNLTEISLPFGGGFKFPVSDNVRIGIETGFRYTFTDYMDDVSKTYIDQTLLAANRGALAVDLSYRGDEIKGDPYPNAGVPRGGSKYKDIYYTTQLTASFRLGAGGGRSKRGVGCPSGL